MIGLLLDHLWQSTVFALAAGLLTLLLRRNGASARYGLWFAASVKFLIPFSLLSALGGRLFQPIAPAISTPPLLLDMQPAARPFSAATPVLSAPVVTASLHLEPVLLVIWALGAAAILTLWLVRWSRLRTALRGAETLTLEAPIPVKSSATSLEPGLIGILNPVLLLPQGIAERLSPPEMQAVLAHELCHLKRRDNLLAAIHMLVEALFWFYPLVWWLGARLIAERERACDEAVVESGNDPQVYAEGILKVCKFYLHSPLACAAGVSGADLKQRVETIMESRFILRLNGAKKFLLAACATAAIAVPIALGTAVSPPMLAQERPALTPDQLARNLAEQLRPRNVVPFDPAAFDKFAGYYQLAPNVIFTISRNGDHFQTRLSGQSAVEIYPESQTKFFATAVAAQISFNTNSQGQVTELVLHQGGMEQHARRIDAATAKAEADALAQRIMNNRPGRGTLASLQHYIASLETGQPNYAEMTPFLASAVHRQLPQTEALIRKWGALKSIDFVRVGAQGGDTFDVKFAHGEVEWIVAPLTSDGKVQFRSFHELP